MNRKMVQELNPEAILLDDAFDIAIVGVGSNALGNVVAIYSQKDCLDIISSDGVDDKDASMLLNTFVQHSFGRYAPVFLVEIWEIA